MNRQDPPVWILHESSKRICRKVNIKFISEGQSGSSFLTWGQGKSTSQHYWISPSWSLIKLVFPLLTVITRKWQMRRKFISLQFKKLNPFLCLMLKNMHYFILIMQLDFKLATSECVLLSVFHPWRLLTFQVLKPLLPSVIK